MEHQSTPLTSMRLADPEPDHEWKPGDPALVPTYTDGGEMGSYVGRYGRRNAANNGWDLVHWEVQRLIPYGSPSDPTGWPATMFGWADAVSEVSARTGETLIDCARRLRHVVQDQHASTSIVVPPEALTALEVDVTLGLR